MNRPLYHIDTLRAIFDKHEDTPQTPEPMPQAAVNEPGDKGVQLGAFGVPDKIIVTKAPECQGRLFDEELYNDNLLET